MDAKNRGRNPELDGFRGLIIVLMVLDHVRSILWSNQDPTALMALFLMRSSQFNLIIGFILALTGMPLVSNLISGKLWYVFFGTPFFEQGILGLDVYFLYAVGPWFGLMLLGYALPAYPWSTKRIAYVGLVLLGLFFVQGFMAAPADWMDFMRVSKYPPEPRFMLGTLGLSAFILLGIRRFPVSWLATLGREPLTLYMVHLVLIFILGRFVDLNHVYWIYVIWALVVAVLIPIAWGMTRLKQESFTGASCRFDDDQLNCD